MAFYAIDALLFWLFTASIVYADGTPWAAAWSSQTYGPDGPWHAVSVEMGSNSQAVDLYPGARWASTILVSSVCQDNSTIHCYAERAGLYDINSSTTADWFNPNKDRDELDWTDNIYAAGASVWGAPGTVKTGVIGDTLKMAQWHAVPHVSITAVFDAYQTYPNGKAYPVSVGTLSLGAPRSVHTLERSNGTWSDLNLLAPWEYFNNTSVDRIPSMSWGMHIGSVDPEIPGSLILGGYDQNRVLGDVSSQQVVSTQALGDLDIYLQGIGIGVATGGSPFNFKDKSDFLKSGVSVAIDPTRPYLYLSKETCDAIAAELPVTFNDDLGLYFWNTSSSSYQTITSSPAYLSFTFYKDTSNSQNITIKVPFALLKLTLQEPLVTKNTTYFPCYPSTSYVLGRAFLQAAFVGTNWMYDNGTGYFFLAQAPGPGTGTSNQQTIRVGDTTINTSTTSSWQDSWNDSWTPIEDSSNSTSSSSGLSTGAKAGIGVGCGIAGLLLIGIAAWLFIVRRKRSRSLPESNSQYASVSQLPNSERIAEPLSELHTLPEELPNKIDNSHEVPSAERHELQ